MSISDILAFQQNLASSGFGQLYDCARDGRFARAGFAYQAQSAAGRNAEANAIDRGQLPITDDEIARFQLIHAPASSSGSVLKKQAIR